MQQVAPPIPRRISIKPPRMLNVVHQALRANILLTSHQNTMKQDGKGQTKHQQNQQIDTV